jgi:surface protein
MRLYAVPGGIINVKRIYNESKFFEFTVQTTGPSETFALPLEAAGDYDFRINWGDDNFDDITVWNDAAVTHTYASAGTHTVSISGVIQGWRFNNGGDKTKIYGISAWGPLKLGNNNGYFYGCSNLTVSTVDLLDLTDTSNFSYAFRGCSSLTTLDVSAWDTAAVTNFTYAFRGCSSLTALDVSTWDTAAVTNFSYAFHGCSSLTTLAANSWDITSVTTMGNMLQNVTLTTANYSDIIVAFEAQAVLNNVPLHGGNSKYSAGAAANARAALIADHSWIITDGGQE